MKRRTLILGAAGAVVAAAGGTAPAFAEEVAPTGGQPVATPPVATAPRVSVSDLTALQTAIGEAKPGTTIEMRNGVYAVPDGAPIRIAGVRGWQNRPITIAAETVGGVTFTGAQSFVFADAHDVVISGFVLTQSTTLEIPADCSRITLSRNELTFADVEGLHWVMVRSDDSVVEYNHFHGKTTLGIFLGIEGAGTTAMARNTHVHHNLFADHHFAGSNGGEPIRLGVSPRALSSANALVEYNLFERANGDPEAISVKSSDNTLRYNTIRSSFGGIVLRHGNRTRVEGNHLIGGENGIRIYGNDHVIVNNSLVGLAGSAVVIGAGTVRDHYEGEPSTSRTKNDAADRVLIALNTFAGNGDGIIGETHRPLEPHDAVIADNIIVGDAGALARVPNSQGFTWSGNLLWGAAEDGDLPAAGFTRIDPSLEQDADGVFRITAASPAVNAATRSYDDVTREDIDGHRRRAVTDAGAHEYTPAPGIRGPLDVEDVGPHAQ